MRTNWACTWKYLSGSDGRITRSGQSWRASRTRKPTLTPRRLASYDGAMTQPPGETLAATPTGRPRKLGRACCSIMAKQELRSMCMRSGSAWLCGKSIADLLKHPMQRLGVELESVVGRAV